MGRHCSGMVVVARRPCRRPGFLNLLILFFFMGRMEEDGEENLRVLLSLETLCGRIIDIYVAKLEL